jgi:hypothetical protein
MSHDDDTKPLTVAEHGARLLADSTDFRGMSDIEVKRHVVAELLDISADHPDAFYEGAFNALADGGDLWMARARREARLRQRAALQATTPAARG